MAIFPIANPIGMSTIFLSLTRYHSAAERRLMSKRIAIYSFFIYWITLLAGSWIMSFFSISIPIIKVAGGLVVYFAAWNMLNSKPKITPKEQQESISNEGDITFFPLTMPITTGAGSLAMAMAIGASIINRGFFNPHAMVEFVGATIGIIGISLTVFCSYYFADRIFAKLGTIGTNVVTQLSAFILLAVSVEIIWEGIKALILTLPH